MAKLLIPLLLLLSLSLNAGTLSPKVLVVLWRGETAAELGYRYELDRNGLQPEFTYLNANQDRAALAKKLRELESSVEYFDVVYSFGTSASKMVKAFLKDRKPHVFNVVTDPVASELVIQESGRESFLKLTGVSDKIQAGRKLELAAERFPVSKILFLMNPKEQNSEIQRMEIHQACEALSCTVDTVRIHAENLSAVLNKLREKSFDADTIYIPSDSYLISNAKLIMDAVKRSPYRTIVPTADVFKLGGTIAIDPDYFELGVEAAKSTIRILNGEHAGFIDVKRSSEPKIYYQKKVEY